MIWRMAHGADTPAPPTVTTELVPWIAAGLTLLGLLGVGVAFGHLLIRKRRSGPGAPLTSSERNSRYFAGFVLIAACVMSFDTLAYRETTSTTSGSSERPSVAREVNNGSPAKVNSRGRTSGAMSTLTPSTGRSALSI